MTQVIYTSGTTGEPKGVMHTANTTLANILPHAQRLRLGASDVVLMASPMAHQTGFMYGLMMPILLQATAVLQGIWDPVKAIDSLKTFVCAGAPIPGPLIELDDPDERAFSTDGKPLPGAEIRIADPEGKPRSPGQPGRLLVRSCSNFGGYLKRPHLNGTDADDWFDTGDLAYQDAQGYIRISGRSKDVIIRGGENIPVVEIESMLYRHPAIAMVAVVAYPDERLGERAFQKFKLREQLKRLLSN